LSALANGKHGRSEVACYFVVNYISLPSKHEYESHFIGIFIDVGVIGKLKGNFVFTKSTLLNLKKNFFVRKLKFEAIRPFEALCILDCG